MAGDLSGNKKRVFEELLQVDVVRGPHSTGVGVARRYKDELIVTKSVGPPADLMSLKDYQDMMKDTAKVYMGHNRYATVGKITDDNAHPFVFPNVIGAHNGTIDPKCRGRLHEADLFGTDSEAIISHINEFGAAETFKLIHNSSYSNNAWALTWFNAVDNTINIARNGKRPLYYVYSEDQCTMFWASESPMLRWVLGRNHVKIFEDTVYVVGEDNHCRWEIPKSMNDKFTTPKISKIEKAKAIEPAYVFQSHVNNNQYHHVSNSNVVHINTNSPSVLTKKKRERLSINTDKWKPPYKDFNGMAIGKARIGEKIKDGCTFCSPKVAAEFAENFKWGDFVFFLKPDIDGRTMFLCEDCYNDNEIKLVCEELI